MRNRLGWATLVSGAQLQQALGYAAGVLCAEAAAGEMPGDVPESLIDPCWEVFWQVLDHGTGAGATLPDSNVLRIYTAVGDQMPGPFIRQVRPAMQREYFFGRYIRVDMVPPPNTFVGQISPANAKYVVGVKRVQSPGHPFPLTSFPVVHTATLDTPKQVAAQRVTIERVEAACVGATVDNNELTSYLQLFDSTAAPIAGAIPVWSARMQELNDGVGRDGLRLDFWNNSWVAVSSTPDVYTQYGGADQTRLFLRAQGGVDLIDGNS